MSQSHWGCPMRRLWPRSVLATPWQGGSPEHCRHELSYQAVTHLSCAPCRDNSDNGIWAAWKRSSRDLPPCINRWDDIWCSVRCYRSLSSHNTSFLHTIPILFSGPWLVWLYSDTKPWGSLGSRRITWFRKEDNNITIPNKNQGKKSD